MDVCVLDENLEMVWLADQYKSLIWAKRYRENGDFELYLPASPEALDALKMGYYVARTDDDMVCRINYVELTTDAESGNYLTVRGVDTKALLDQRIIWGTANCNGNLESFIAGVVNDALGSSASSSRKMKKKNAGQMVYTAPLQGFNVANTEQVSYKNVGEKVREYCEKNGWGSRMLLDDGKLYFGLYAGTDHRNDVIFSDEYENIATTVYSQDKTNMGNVAAVAGEGEGSKRAVRMSGSASGTDRYEIFVDARDISRSITFEELASTYPTGTAVLLGAGYVWNVTNLDVQIIDARWLATLEGAFAGEVVTVDGVEYYRVYSADVAALPSATPADTDDVELKDLVYLAYLLNRGYEKLAEYGAVTSFEGTIEPRNTFQYKRDYDMGDLVTVRSSYGVSAAVRIVEVIEVDDDNGYSVQPTFEYVEEQ